MGKVINMQGIEIKNIILSPLEELLKELGVEVSDEGLVYLQQKYLVTKTSV